MRNLLLTAAGFSLFSNLMLLGPTLYMLQVYDRVLVSRSVPTLVMLSIAVAAALLAMLLVDWSRSRLLLETARRLDERLGEPVLRRVAAQASRLAPSDGGQGLKDVAILRGFFTGNSIIALFDLPWLVFYLFIIYLFHPLLGMTALGGAVLMITLAWSNERATRAGIEAYQNSSRRGSAFIDQGLRNADVLNGMGMVPAFSGRWQAYNAETLGLMERNGVRLGLSQATSKFLRQSIQSLLMGLGAWLVIGQESTPGIMIAATILYGRAMAPVEGLFGNWTTLIATRSAYQRLQAMMPGLTPPAHTPLPPPEGRIQLERVVLAGRNPERPILRQVDFDLPAGRSLGILGPSGSGKSSLAKVIIGLWASSSGQVRLDGAELSQWDPDVLGGHIGYLPQDVELFPGTIAENISRFQEPLEDEVLEAARRAFAYEMILRLPDGFDTRIGPGGIRLSGGQAQRIGLARALYNRPRLVVLDEPNANLDAEGEQALQRTLETLQAEESTLVMITHKPQLVSSIDYLLVLRDGRQELLGPRDQVLARLFAPAGSPG